ncbi:MAG: hypothetical protein RLN89_07855 [Parvibaculum sp.]
MSNDQYVQERPAWLIPLVVIAGVTIFSAAFVYYYFGPTPSELLGLDPRASESTERVDVEIGEMRFLVPANFTRYPLQRIGGLQEEIDLHALLPELSPYSLRRREEFESNAEDSNAIHFKIFKTDDLLPAARRLDDVYMRHLTNHQPLEGPYGLSLYNFAETSGYRDQILLTADMEPDTFLLLCFNASEIVFSPTCTRTFHLQDNIAITYRYKRAHLEDWLRIDTALIALVQSFIVPHKEDETLDR